MQPRLLRLLQYQPRNNIRNDRSTLSFNHDHRSNGLHDRKASPLCRFNTIGLQHSAICISLEKQCRTHENECKLGNAQTNCPKTHVRCTVQSRPAAFLFGAASQILHIQLLCSFELPKKSGDTTRPASNSNFIRSGLSLSRALSIAAKDGRPGQPSPSSLWTVSLPCLSVNFFHLASSVQSSVERISYRYLRRSRIAWRSLMCYRFLSARVSRPLDGSDQSVTFLRWKAIEAG